ncbi:MAG: hypothetical protein AAF557_05450 [Pseudomonadota bacterium]
MAEIEAQKAQIFSQYAPKIPSVANYCVKALETGAYDGALLLDAGFEEFQPLFGQDAYSAEFETEQFNSRVFVGKKAPNCSIRFYGVYVDAHREAFVQALQEQGFQLTKASPQDPITEVTIAGALGMARSNVQYAKRDDLILELALVSSPGGRKSGFVDEVILKVNAALLPFE